MHISQPPPWFWSRGSRRFEMLNHTSYQGKHLFWICSSLFSSSFSDSLWLSPYLKHPALPLFPCWLSPVERGWTSWSWLGQNRATGMCQEMRKLVEILKGGFGEKDTSPGLREAACDGVAEIPRLPIYDVATLPHQWWPASSESYCWIINWAGGINYATIQDSPLLRSHYIE